MRLRNISKNVKDQNWFAVFLDFLIVVLGVYIGIQLGNWNQVRQNQSSMQAAQVRFAAENKANIETTDEFLAEIQGRLSRVEAAVGALRNCQADDAAREKINMGLNVIRGTGFLNIRTTALSGLTTKDSFLSLMAEDEREQLKEFERQVEQAQKTLDWLEQQPFRNHIEDQQGIAFGELVNPPALDGAKIRMLSLERPISEACQDKKLLSSFYLWERTTTFQYLRAKQLREKFEANLN